MVKVHAMSVNCGEPEQPAGWRPRWDFAGEVVDGAGEPLPAGARVCGLASGNAWKEVASVPVSHLVQLPKVVPFDIAAALPSAGLTALRALRRLPSITNQSVLVNGAAVALGRLAIQLARLQGATVHARVCSHEQGRGLVELGAAKVWTDNDPPTGTFDIVLENVGRHSLGDAVERVAPHGTIVTYGISGGGIAAPDRAGFNRKHATLCRCVLLEDIGARPPARDLAYLLDLVARGHLRVDRSNTVSWYQMPAALETLAARPFAEKAALPASGSQQSRR